MKIESNTAENDQGRSVLLSQLLAGCLDITPDQNRAVGELQINSRQVRTGDVFFALPGNRADGRDYIDQAIAKRAAAVVYEQQGTPRSPGIVDKTPVLGIRGLRDMLGMIASQYYGLPTQKLRVTGVTGTNGKTTTAYLLAQALDCCGIPCAYSGTVGSGMVDALKPSDLTTVDAISMQQRLAEYVDSGADALVMEVSSHGLDQGRVNGIGFDVGIFTNLSRDHLDYHHTMEQYYAAKRKLFEFSSLSVAVVNTDDAFGRKVAHYCQQRADRPKCVTFGTSGQELLYPENVIFNDQGIDFDTVLEGRSLHVHSRLVGQVNLHNLLAVICALQALGISSEEIAAVIPRLAPPPGRMEMFRGTPGIPAVVVDYAHTPNALECALISLGELCQGKLVAIFGCGGDRDQGKRPLMGQVAEKYADKVILTNDNPRSEPPEVIIEEIVSGMKCRPPIIFDRVEAIRQAINEHCEKDIILLAGKGHEKKQIVSGMALDFDDRKLVSKLLGGVS